MNTLAPGAGGRKFLAIDIRCSRPIDEADALHCEI